MPRAIVETVTVRWIAVTDPVRCQCGHRHYGRVPSNNNKMAPQWNFCEDTDCQCRGLRPTKKGSTHE